MLAEQSENLPAAVRTAGRFSGGLEPLAAAIGVDVAAFGFRHRRQREYHIGDLQQVIAGKGCDRDDRFGFGQASARGLRVGDVEFRLQVEQQVALAPLPELFNGRHAAGVRYHAGTPCALAVGRPRQNHQRRLGCTRNLGGQRAQAAGFGVEQCLIAKDQEPVVGIDEAAGDLVRGRFRAALGNEPAQR